MFCGSCMRDNAIVAAMQHLDCDVQLIPTYTPIRTDEENVSLDTVLFGGINVYLQDKWSLFRWLPSFLDRWLDNPFLIGLLASRGMETDARQLGSMTVSMLQGERGRQRKEVKRLVHWLDTHTKPDLVNMSNLLIAGSMPAIQRDLKIPVLVTLQGDDLFLESLIEPYKSQAMAEIRKLAAQVDGFIVFSRFYAQKMAALFEVPLERFHIVPLGIDLRDFGHVSDTLPAEDPETLDRPPTVGYLARICPEKGLHHLFDAFLQLRSMPGTENAHLRLAGWLSKKDEPFFCEQMQRLRSAGIGDEVHYAGVVDRGAKLSFLRSLDILSVPTVYEEPKGIFVLEALASGVPVVQPDHGAFGELIGQTGGGKLVPANDPRELALQLHHLLTNRDERRNLAHFGRKQVHERFGSRFAAEATLDVYRQFLKQTDQR